MPNCGFVRARDTSPGFSEVAEVLDVTREVWALESLEPTTMSLIPFCHGAVPGISSSQDERRRVGQMLDGGEHGLGLRRGLLEFGLWVGICDHSHAGEEPSPCYRRSH